MSPLARPGPLDLDGGVDPGTLKWDRNGLVVGVVQDVADGRVLMVGWMDVEALAATLGTGDVHFHSRSRGRLWRKGESSGNVLKPPFAGARLRRRRAPHRRGAAGADLSPRDPVVLRPRCPLEGRPGLRPGREHAAAGLRPDGAARGERRLAGLRLARGPVGDDRGAGGAASPRLVHGRAARRRRRCGGPQGRGRGDRGAARGEEREAAEAAGTDRTELRELLVGEAADLVYHALVLLAERGVEPRDVVTTLRGRHGRTVRT